MKNQKNNIITKEIHNRLAKCIKESGYQQKVIAKNIGVSFQTVSKYITKDIFPALDTLAKLCIFLNVSADYILGLAEL